MLPPHSAPRAAGSAMARLAPIPARIGAGTPRLVAVAATLDRSLSRDRSSGLDRSSFRGRGSGHDWSRSPACRISLLRATITANISTAPAARTTRAEVAQVARPATAATGTAGIWTRMMTTSTPCRPRSHGPCRSRRHGALGTAPRRTHQARTEDGRAARAAPLAAAATTAIRPQTTRLTWMTARK
jgi:hypothetical protein